MIDADGMSEGDAHDQMDRQGRDFQQESDNRINNQKLVNAAITQFAASMALTAAGGNGSSSDQCCQTKRSSIPNNQQASLPATATHMNNEMQRVVNQASTPLKEPFGGHYTGPVRRASGAIDELFSETAILQVGLVAMTWGENAEAEGLMTVGRWISPTEYEAMKEGGRVLEGAGGLTFVTTGGLEAFQGAAKGSVYVEFQIPTNSMLKGGVASFQLITHRITLLFVAIWCII